METFGKLITYFPRLLDFYLYRILSVKILYIKNIHLYIKIKIIHLNI